VVEHPAEAIVELLVEELGGAGLAAAAIELGLVDELRMFRNPVVVGGGTPFLPPVTEDVSLDLIETRTFGSRVIYERYGRARDEGLTPLTSRSAARLAGVRAVRRHEIGGREVPRARRSRPSLPLPACAQWRAARRSDCWFPCGATSARRP
jgi:hypothetical protein